MVRALEQEQENYRSRLFHFKGMYENASRHTKSLSIESASALGCSDDDAMSARSHGAKPLSDPDKQQIGSALHRNDKGPKTRLRQEEMAAKEARDKLNAGQCHSYFSFFLTASSRNLLLQKVL